MDEKGDELDPEWGGGEVLLKDYVALLVETVLPRIHPLPGMANCAKCANWNSHGKLCGASRSIKCAAAQL